MPNIFFAKSVERPSYEIEHAQMKYAFGNVINVPKRVTWNPITIEFYDVIYSKVYIGNNVNEASASYSTVSTENRRILVEQQELGSPQGGRKPGVGTYRYTTSGYFSSRLSKAGYAGASNAQISVLSYTFKQNLVKALLGEESNYLNPGPPVNEIKINELDEFGNTIETWTLVNPLIKSVKFSTLDYSSDDVSTVSVTLAYDYANHDLTEHDKQYVGEDKPELKKFYSMTSSLSTTVSKDDAAWKNAYASSSIEETPKTDVNKDTAWKNNYMLISRPKPPQQGTQAEAVAQQQDQQYNGIYRENLDSLKYDVPSTLSLVPK